MLYVYETITTKTTLRRESLKRRVKITFTLVPRRALVLEDIDCVSPKVVCLCTQMTFLTHSLFYSILLFFNEDW